MKQKLLLSAVIMIATFLSSTSVAQNLDPVAGEKSGFFSIGRNTKARFSQGNLQYQASTGTWRFAEHQWDYVGSQNPSNGSPGGTVAGSDNRSVSSTYSGWIDLFGWGTSGWNSGAVCYQPWATSSRDSDYYPGGSSTTDLTGSYARADWGVYNAISNGGNDAGLWRTLTKDEWVYLFTARSASTLNGVTNARYAKSTVGGVAGIIMFPDSYSHPAGVALPTSINVSSANYITNNYSSTDWTAIEAAGAVFLPAAGFREGSYVCHVGNICDYWSSTCYDSIRACRIYIKNEFCNFNSYERRLHGFPVRLVRSYPCNSASTEVMTSCDSYTWHGRTFTSSTDTATYTTTNAAGCDSVVTLHLTIGRDTSVNIVCSTGQTLTYNLHCSSGTATLTGYSGTCTGALSIPDSVSFNGITYSVDSIGESAFRNCKEITALTIPNSIVSIDDDAFRGCGNVVSCVVHSSNGVYDSRNSCNAIIHTATNKLIFGCRNTVIPNTVTNIGNTSFNWCIGLISITIPSTVTAIGQNPFRGCEDLTSIVVESGNSVYDSRNGCNAIISTATNKLVTGCKSTVIPNNVAIIGFSAFEECGISGDITIPNTVTTIEHYAFKNCSTLTGTLVIPSSVVSIGEAAFRACSGFTAIKSLAIVPPTLGTTDVFGIIPTTTPVSVPCESVAAYRAASGWSYFSNIKGLYYSQVTDSINACNSYTWHGRTFTASTDTATYTTTNVAGCDSVVTLHLTINHCSTTVTTACDSLVWNSITYRTDGTYKHGNDTLVLTVNHSTTGTETVTACNSYTWHGPNYTTSTTTPTYTTTNAAGCDSVVTLNLTVNHCSTTEIAACGNLRWHNTTYSASGTYTDGNDTLILTINHSTSGSETVAACNSYEWHGRTFTASVDTAKYTTTNAAGCDSVVTLHLTINHDSSRVFTAEALNSYTWVIRNNSHTYTQSGTYIDHYTTVHGCSGTDTLHLTITASERYYNVRVASNNSSWGRAYLVSDSRVQQGRQGVVRVTPNRGYRFSHWSDGSTASPYAFTVTQDTLLVAYFEPATFTVTLNNANPGCGIVSGSGSVNYGSRHNIAAAPNYGYRFIRWDDGDINAHRTITVTNNVTLTAYFGVRQFSVSALPANYAHGTVTGGGNYDYRSMVTLAATPNGGYEFDHWSDGETLNPRRITVTRDTVLTAVFRMVPVIPTHTVTVVSANPAMGSVIGGGTYDEGAVAAIAAIAASGCEFTGWTDGSTANPRMITVTGDTVFTATFREIYVPSSYTITVTSNDPELGRVSGSGTYDAGETVHLNAYPSAHVHFLRWSDGSTEANRSFAASGNLSLTAIFARDSLTIKTRVNDDRMGHVVGGGAYPIGGEATLTAIPNYGYRFICWSHGETSSTITFTVRYADTYTALFESTTQGVDEAEGESVRVWSHGLTIHVAGLTGEPLRVYDVTGRLVAERTAAHGDMVIPVTHPGLYLVQTGTATHKVLTR